MSLEAGAKRPAAEVSFLNRFSGPTNGRRSRLPALVCCCWFSLLGKFLILFLVLRWFSCAAPLREAGEQFALGRLHFGCRFGVRLGSRPGFQILYGDIGFEMSRQARQLPQDLPGRGIPPVDSFHFAFGVDHLLGHAAGTMKV